MGDSDDSVGGGELTSLDEILGGRDIKTIKRAFIDGDEYIMIGLHQNKWSPLSQDNRDSIAVRVLPV
jgi:hypothetical protein